MQAIRRFNSFNKSSRGSLGIDAKSWLGVSKFWPFKKSIFTAWLFSQVLPFYNITNPNHEKHYWKSLKKDLQVWFLQFWLNWLFENIENCMKKRVYSESIYRRFELKKRWIFEKYKINHTHHTHYQQAVKYRPFGWSFLLLILYKHEKLEKKSDF